MCYSMMETDCGSSSQRSPSLYLSYTCGGAKVVMDGQDCIFEFVQQGSQEADFQKMRGLCLQVLRKSLLSPATEVHMNHSSKYLEDWEEACLIPVVLERVIQQELY